MFSVDTRIFDYLNEWFYKLYGLSKKQIGHRISLLTKWLMRVQNLNICTSIFNPNFINLKWLSNKKH